MDRVSNVDRLVQVLRQRLQEREAARRGTLSRTDSAAPADPLGAVRALAASQAVDDREFRRFLIQNLLADQLGRTLTNDARFHQTVEQVLEVIETDEAARSLLERVVGDLSTRALRNT
ncbi:hypothetical protein [Brevundimonas sp.]|jgi:hypothetical protein|uniref:hypothetical protein n=1 Tax=Brevundimonas sp. TaxID=1871086 RepID=UPI002E12BEBE|nr:hypothetical protein [Brevundimonas sp.]